MRDAEAVRLGIAISTFNRRPMLLGLIDALQAQTSRDFDLVVCDDGSTDNTVAALRARGVPVIAGANRGIAWNKNRGLFYLREILGCDVILLLDDDVLPVRQGWERDWIAAVRKFGHINFLSDSGLLLSGANSPEDPGVSGDLWGACVAFSRAASSYVGYFDTRFRGYGHEHTDLTMRAIRAGFGGFLVEEDGVTHHRFYAIEGGLKLLPSQSAIDKASVARNQPVWAESQAEPIFRNAWRTVEEYTLLRSELAALDGLQPAHQPVAEAAAGMNLARGKAAMQSSTSEWSTGATAAQDAGGAVNGRPNGKRQFHTALEAEPWWQVDLDQPMVFSEVRVFNTLEPVPSERFRRFRISVAFDPGDWIEVYRKDDDAPVGGIGDPFVWRPALSAFARFVRITLCDRNFLHLDQVEVWGRAPPPPRNIPDKELFARFISLGDNCEFGVVQRNVGLEPVDLLRFGGTGADETGVILAMRERFAAFGTAEDTMISNNKGEWIAWTRRYGVSFHTERHKPQFEEAQIFSDMSKRLRALAGKLVEDLEAADKIFIRKSNKPVTEATMFTFHEAMRGYGKPTLLWVSLADAAHEHATVERLAPGFLHGYIRRLAPYENATDVRVADWRDVCAAALAADRADG